MVATGRTSGRPVSASMNGWPSGTTPLEVNVAEKLVLITFAFADVSGSVHAAAVGTNDSFWVRR